MSILPRIPALLRSLLSAGALALLGAAAAQGVTMAPVVMTLNPDRTQSTQTTFSNDTPLTFEYTVEVYAWTMKDGQHVLTPTRDVVVNPAQFRLAPGTTQVIRAGLRKKAGDTELAYRMIVTQLPLANGAGSGQASGEGSQVNVSVTPRFSLPIYVARDSAQPKVGYSVKADGADLLLTMQNAGNRHQTYNRLQVTGGGKTFELSSQAVLAGGAYTLRLPGWAGVTGPLKLSFRDYAGRAVDETVARP